MDLGLFRFVLGIREFCSVPQFFTGFEVWVLG